MISMMKTLRCIAMVVVVLGMAVPACASGSIIGWGSQVVGVDLSGPFVAVAAGQYHSLGLKADGSIVAWGYNANGQCEVSAPNTGFVAVAAGYSHSLGLKADGSIVAWGSNYDGQCDVPAPNTGFVTLAAGQYHSLGLRADGSVVAWGAGQPGETGWPHYGQCEVSAPNTGFVAVAAGAYHSLGLKSDGWPPVLTVQIDIKPGSYPNPINLKSRGVIPVAILSTADFDATTVDPATVQLAGSSVAVCGNGKHLLCAEEDVDGDGDLDLVMHFETDDLVLDAASTEATLTGETYDGTMIQGSDSVLIVPHG